MAEWSIAAVLKTVVLRGTGGSNPSLSADKEGASNDAPSFFRHSSYFPLRKGESKDSIRHLLKERCLSTLGEVRVNDMTFSEDYRVIRVIRA